MGKRGLVDFQLLLCWIGATDHINHGVVRLWCPIGVQIAQVIQYEYQKKGRQQHGGLLLLHSGVFFPRLFSAEINKGRQVLHMNHAR